MILLISFCVTASADELFRWVDENGKEIPETDTLKSDKCFGGRLVTTSDDDWEDVWDTPVSTVPMFTFENTVAKGDKLYILVMHANPAKSELNTIDIGCDIKVTRPDNSVSIDATGIDCASGEILGNSYNVRMTNLAITFIAEPDDIVGAWHINITLKDRIREAEVSLGTEFIVVD